MPSVKVEQSIRTRRKSGANEHEIGAATTTTKTATTRMEERQSTRVILSRKNRKRNRSKPQSRNCTIHRNIVYLNKPSARESKVAYPKKITGPISKMYEWTKPRLQDRLEYCEY